MGFWRRSSLVGRATGFPSTGLSRFFWSISLVTVFDLTPVAGTSPLATQTMAFRTSLRNSSIAQFLW